MLHEELICLFISRKFQCGVFARQPFFKDGSRAAQTVSVTPVRERTCLYLRLSVPCSVYSTVNRSHSAQLLWSVTAVVLLIPVWFRQPVEHQGWPRTSPLSTAIMKTLVFRDPLAKWAKSGRNSCKALLNNEKTKKLSLHWLKGRPIAKLQYHCHHSPLWGHFQSPNAPVHVIGHLASRRKD